MSAATASPPKYVTAADVADVFGIKQEKTVLELVKREGLPAHRIGRQYRFVLNEVAEWSARRVVGDSNDAPTSSPDAAGGEVTWLDETLAKFTPDDLRRAGEVLQAVANAATSQAGAA